MRGDFERVVEFIKNGDDINAAHEEFGYSPLHAAAEFGIVFEPLERGCESERDRDKSYKTYTSSSRFCMW